ncbi:MAG: hypothetical protein ACE5GD_04955 [Candidatus Geothermarchaeales archaeon]
MKEFGDPEPVVEQTLARGIIGVKTSLDTRGVVSRLCRVLRDRPEAITFTLKWVPIDLWTYSDLESMKRAVSEISDGILPYERWRMTVEKRRYATLHKIDIIKELAPLIPGEVNLEEFEKEVRVEVIGKYAGISILKRGEALSVVKALWE